MPEEPKKDQSDRDFDAYVARCGKSGGNVSVGTEEDMQAIIVVPAPKPDETRN